MNCSNTKCKKEIRNYYTCNKCGKLFCSNSCITDHTLEHNINNNQIGQRTSGMRSIFIKMGQFNKDIIDDPYYKFKNFEVVKNKNILGSGAFGEVFLVKHKKDGKLFALKSMSKQKIIESGASLDIIYREISIHIRIKHENIVTLYSYHEDEENFNLIMDYANSGSLFSQIKKNKFLDEKKAFKYFIQVAAAVYFLHNNNLLHRDLKPENILIDENDIVKLCDFGWCVDLTQGNRVTFCGTYEYMAPEIIKEIPYDYSIDSWSLGILLYELTHGYSPFRSQVKGNEDYDEIFRNILKYNFKIEKPLSKNCQDIISRLLSQNDKERLRLKDIFAHPWVIEFEKEEKDRRIKNSMNEKNSSDNNKLVSNILEDINKKDLKHDKLNINNDSKKNIEIEESKHIKNSKFDEMDINANNSIYAYENNLDIDDNDEKKKKKKKKKEIDIESNIVPNVEIKQNKDPFDDIMNQVQKRNKDKKKKKKEEDINKKYDYNDDSFRILKNEDEMDEKNKKYIKKGDTKNEKLDKELDHKEIKKIINVKEEPKIVKSTNDVKKIEESKVIKNDAKKIDKKEINKEFNMYAPKDIYSENKYNESNKHLIAAIDILEKAQNQQDKIKLSEDEQEPGFWNKVGSWLNPFKCGKND